MLELTVHIDNNSGFCFGVIYAIEMAEDILKEKGYLYCLGDIVHNEEEIERLKKKGLRIIDHEELKGLRGEQVLIRAHGEPASTYKLALENELELIDASCPVVLKLQNRIKNASDSGVPILIYGKHGHAEVTGLLAQTNNEATVFEFQEELDIQSLPKEVVLFSQTTKSTSKFYEVSNTLTNAGIDVKANDTICRQVSNRDKELSAFVKNYDKIIFVSGKKSSNGKVLYNVCKENNPQTYFVSSTDEIDNSVFVKGDKVGICGATSTPMWLMEAIRENLLSL